ncbi:hypothetical protein MKC73_01285 [[Clostridium] innocuum]|nr:hypothetical protein [[Clostridium] innocuum]
MKQTKLLFLLRDDLTSTSQRVIIRISEEDHEYCIGRGDDDREYVLKQSERYKVLRNPRGIQVFGTDEDICHYLLFKYCRDVAPDVTYPTGWLKELEERFEQIRCDDLSVFYDKENE